MKRATLIPNSIGFEERGVSPVFASVLLIGMTVAFAGVFSMNLNKWTTSPETPQLKLDMRDVPSTENGETVYEFFHDGGGHVDWG